LQVARAQTRPLTVAGETHVAIVHLFAHRDGECDTQAADEILFVIAVEDDGMHQADVALACIKIEAYCERQPFAGAPGVAL
jgi:hypothetical protein